MSKDSCARYYQKTPQKQRKDSKKRFLKGIKTLLKKKKTESEDMGANDMFFWIVGCRKRYYERRKNKNVL